MIRVDIVRYAFSSRESSILRGDLMYSLHYSFF
jgi:hypothetical protein